MPLTPVQRTALNEAFGSAITFNAATCCEYGQSVGALASEPPDAVLKCDSVDQIVASVRLAIEHGIPIVPFGAGTSLEGQVNCPHGGVCLDMRGLDAVLSINESDLYAVVEPGVTHSKLNDCLRHTNLMFPTDPGAKATLGGMASTRASGTMTVRYGSMRENVIAAEVVTGLGERIKVGRLANKSAAGYDLLPLFVGAEGTLGVFTNLTVRLHPVPSAVMSGVACFDDVTAAVQSVIDARAIGLPLARIELLDELGVAACNEYSRLDLPQKPHIFVEFHDSAAGIQAAAEAFERIAAAAGGRFQHSESPEEQSKLWRARHDAWWAIHAKHPGKHGTTSDVCVPLSHLPAAIRYARELLSLHALCGVIVGHVGDGNFHVLVMHDLDDSGERARLADFLDTIARHAIRLGGTCTGEHGIGQGKRELLAFEHGSAVNVMRRVKHLFDPHNIMNPGKLFVPADRIDRTGAYAQAGSET